MLKSLMKCIPWMLAGLVSTASSAHAAHPPDKDRDNEPSVYAFGPGEQALYKVQYLGITAGSAQITVGTEMVHHGKSVWPIVMLAKTDSVASVFPIKDKFITYWDFTQQLSVGNDLLADENRKRRRQRIRMDHGNQKAQVLKQKEGAPEYETTHDIPAKALDVAGAMFALRNKTIDVGAKYEFPVFTGDRSFELMGVCEGKQSLKTALGVQDVYRLRIQAAFSGKLEAKNDLILYVTTDPKHLPVKVEAEFVLGSIVAEITEYQPGREIAFRPSGDTSAQAGANP